VLKKFPEVIFALLLLRVPLVMLKPISRGNIQEYVVYLKASNA
jgi:hypothetical protein